MTQSIDQGNSTICWIYIDGVYHDVSNLCQRGQNNHIVPANATAAEMQRQYDSRTALRRARSPYNFDRTLWKTLMDDKNDSESGFVRRRPPLTSRTLSNIVQGSLRMRLSSFCSSLSSTVSHYDDDDDDNQPVPMKDTDQLSLFDDDTIFYSEDYADWEDEFSAPPQRPTFRGADETWTAFKTGKISLTTCPDCSQRMVSVDDAAYVVCAHCRLVYPLTGPASLPRFGIAMGFKPSWCHSLLNEKANFVKSNIIGVIR